MIRGYVVMSERDRERRDYYGPAHDPNLDNVDERLKIVQETAYKLRDRTTDKKVERAEIFRELAGENELETEADVYKNELKDYATIKQNHYKPKTLIEEIKDTDLFDKKAYTDKSLTVRERLSVIKNMWRAFV